MPHPQISPDGSAVIFYRDIASAGSGDGVQVRHLNTLTPESVRTGGFRNPGFWSPDSRSFVFSDGTNLKKMRVPDGAPEIIANDVATMVGGSWSDNGTLLIAGAMAGGPGLFVVPAAGGVAKRVEVSLPNTFFSIGRSSCREARIFWSWQQRQKTRSRKSTSPRCATAGRPILFC